MQYTGRILPTTDYGEAYGITDTDGEFTLIATDRIAVSCDLGLYPSNIRSVSFLVRQVPALSWLSGWIPGFFKMPYWLWHQAGNKF